MSIANLYIPNADVLYCGEINASNLPAPIKSIATNGTVLSGTGFATLPTYNMYTYIIGNYAISYFLFGPVATTANGGDFHLPYNVLAQPINGNSGPTTSFGSGAGYTAVFGAAAVVVLESLDAGQQYITGQWVAPGNGTATITISGSFMTKLN